MSHYKINFYKISDNFSFGPYMPPNISWVARFHGSILGYQKGMPCCALSIVTVDGKMIDKSIFHAIWRFFPL